MRDQDLNGKRKSEFGDTCRFVELLAKSMQLYGVSSESMISSLSRIAKSLGLNSAFLITPNFVQTMLWTEGQDQQRLNLVEARSGSYDLGKLAKVSKLAKQAEEGLIRPTEGLRSLQAIVDDKEGYSQFINALAFIFCAAAFAVIMGATWMDMLAGAVTALASFGITLIASRSTAIVALQEILAAMIAVFIGNIASEFLPGINPLAVAVVGVIVFVPGFGLTIAPRELILGNTLSGIVWLTNALVTAFKLLGGAAIGSAIAHGIGMGGKPVVLQNSIPQVWTWVAVPALIVALAIIMKMNWRDFWSIILGGWLVWIAVQAGNSLGFWQGTFLGTIVLMVYSKWYARRFRMPSAMIILPCVMILVPGFAALRALSTIRTEGLVAGFQSGYDVLLLIFAIIGGTLVGEALTLQNITKTSKAMKSIIFKSSSHQHTVDN